MTKLMETLGRVMMTAVRLPRSNKSYASMQTYVQTEFKRGDQPYVLDCMLNGRPIDYRNLV